MPGSEGGPDKARKKKNAALRKSDVLARVGGDEFVALLEGANNKTGEKILKRIYNRIEEYNQEPGRSQLLLMVSMGMSVATEKSGSMSDVLEEADHQMYRTKRS